LVIEVISRAIGINLWFAPQISEHWPKNNPGRLEIDTSWLSRPGTASTLIPRDGTVQAWMTSAAVIRNRVLILKGITSRLSTSSSRNEDGSISIWGIIKESNLSLKSAYSYDQYHWWPITLILREGSKDSSIR